MTGRQQIAVIGRGSPDPELEQLAEEVGRRLGEAGATVVCGGLSGVMEGAARGARESGADVIGILPGEYRGEANPHVTHAVATGIGHARNLAVVASADVVVAVGGEWGTLAEIGFARRLGRPVVSLRGPRVSGEGGIGEAPGIEVASSAVEAAERALELAGRRV